MIRDEEFSRAIEADEFDLIDDYATGILPTAERKKVKEWITSYPELQNRVLITQQLRLLKTNLHSARPRWIPWIASTAAACFALVTIALSLRHSTYPPRAAYSTSQAPPFAAIQQQDTILLAAERQRSNPELKSPDMYTVHAANAVRIQILVPPSAAKSAYSIRLRSEAAQMGSPLQFAAIHPQGVEATPYLEVVLSPRSLSSGRYDLKLEGPTGKYDLAFRIEVK